jgi:hypothetical protein
MEKKFVFLFCALTMFLYGSLSAQVREPSYPFARDFVSGIIHLPDGSEKTGLIKWFPAQEEKLVFRENDKAPKQKYRPEELAGFSVDSFRFRSISEFEVYGNDFALLGKMSKINHTFGQLIDSGKVNSYLVYYSGYNALAGAIQSYLNIVFEKKTDSGKLYAACPVALRMKDKKFEKVKDNLVSFFSEYPAVVEKIKSFQKVDGSAQILEIVKNM